VNGDAVAEISSDGIDFADMRNYARDVGGPALRKFTQETISRDGTFTAQHIYTPIQGVAIQINAFNFPCWGMLEKLAPQLLAGVPVIVKPASQTAFLTELMVKHIRSTTRCRRAP